MRISTNTLFDRGVGGVERQQEMLFKTQQQVASGKRILAPSDDPVAAARVLDVGEADAINKQYALNADSASGSLALEESVLQSISNAIHDARATAVNAGNPVLSNSDRASLAAALRSALDEVVTLANTTDAAGHYLFAGYQESTQPFARQGGEIVYAGDEGRRLLQVSAGRQLPVSDPGSEVFQRIRTGNGVFLARADDANTGTGLMGPGSVTNAAALTGHEYEIRFSVAAGATTYTVRDVTANTVSAPAAYTAGSAIDFDGMRVEISGAPADQDVFTVTPSTSQSLFETLSDLADAIAAPTSDAAGGARLSNAIGTGLANLDQALDKILGVRASLGSRMQEVDALKSLSQDFSLQYQQTLSQLQDVDYTAAISDLTREQTYLQAAQQSFVKIAGLSLFDYL